MAGPLENTPEQSVESAPLRTSDFRTSRLWRAWEIPAAVIGLGALGALCLAWFPPAMVLRVLLPRPIGQALGRRVISFGCRLYLNVLRVLCGCRFDLDALDALKDQTPLLVAANHPSLLDAVLIVSRLPNAVCVMKASLMDNPLFGSAARLAHYIRNKSPLELLVRAREELQGNAQVVIFPEGTRTKYFPVDEVLPGTGLISQRSGVPVQTVLIEFSTPYLGKDWPLWRPPALPLTCRIRLGRRFDPPADAVAFKHVLRDYYASELASEQAQGSEAHPS